MSRIFLVGDTHGDIDWGKLTTGNFPQGKELTKDDYVIILGDAAIVWDGDRFDHYIQKWYNEKPWTTLFISGNHDNHDLLNMMKVTEWNGGKVHRISDSIIHLMNGQVYNIGNYSFFVMGGATSVDKIFRKEGISWWSGEIPTYEEFEEGFDNLDKVGNKVDYILSHQAPNDFMDGMGYKRDKVSNYLQIVVDNIEYKQHFCGHHHKDLDLGKLRILYDEIVELGIDNEQEN